MSSISQCQYNIRRYRTLKSNVNSVISKLFLAIDNTNDLNAEIKTKYQVNDSFTPIVSRTKQLKDNIEFTYNHLNNKVIPAIDEAINNLNNEIARLEEEERQRRREEQARREAMEKVGEL